MNYNPNPSRNGLILAVVILLVFVYLFLVGAGLVFPVGLVSAQSDGDDDFPCYPYPGSTPSFCLYWERDQMSDGAPAIDLWGVRPMGDASFVGTWDEQAEDHTWSVLSQNAADEPWDAVITYTLEFLNAPSGDVDIENEIPFPLLWRPDVEPMYKKFLHFAKLHVRARFYAGWGVEVESNGQPYIYTEGGFPDGGFGLRRMRIGSVAECYTWTAEAVTNEPEYAALSTYMRDALNAADDAFVVPDALSVMLEAQFRELDSFLIGVYEQWPGAVECDDEPTAVPTPSPTPTQMPTATPTATPSPTPSPTPMPVGYVVYSPVVIR